MKNPRWASAALKVLPALLVTIVAVEVVFGQHEELPVFVIGKDDGLSPKLIRRDSKEFREVVFRQLAQTMASKGLRAIGEAPFRAKYKVDGVEDVFGSPRGRWESDHFLYYANRVTVDKAGNTAPYIVFVDLWLWGCRDEKTGDPVPFLCLDLGSAIHETASGAFIGGAGPSDNIQIPIPPDCKGPCDWRLWRTRSKALLHSLGMEVAARVLKHFSERHATP